jgi:hypothetical protein
VPNYPDMCVSNNTYCTLAKKPGPIGFTKFQLVTLRKIATEVEQLANRVVPIFCNLLLIKDLGISLVKARYVLTL